MKKISLLILLSMFLVSCGSDCDCKKNKAKYKKMRGTVKVDSVKMEKIKKWRQAKKDSVREWRKAKRDSIK